MTMIVTMLQARMGEAGAVLAAGTSQVVTDAFGAFLVANRYAVSATPKNDNNGQLTAAEAAGMRLRSRTGLFTRSITGRYASEAHSTSDRTTNIQFVLAAPFRAVRIGIINAATGNTVAGVKACAAPTATIGDPGSDAVIIPSGGTGAFVQATFSGSSTATLPAATAFSSPEATSATDYTVTWTDWIDIQSLPRSDGGQGYGLIVRALIPGTTNQAGNTNRTVFQSTALDNWADASIVGWRTYRAARRDADGVTDPALFFTTGFGTWSDSHQALIVQYASEADGLQLTNFSDSIGAGENDGTYPTGTGPVHWAANAIHSADLPCEVANFAVGSSNTANMIKIANKMIPLVRPTHAIWSPFTPNLSLTAANVALMHGKTGRFVDTCRQYNVIPVFWTGLPSTPIGTEGSTQGKTWTPAEDALRIGLNAVYLTGTWPCANFETLAYGGLTEAGQVKLLQAYSYDGLHPNQAGNSAFGVRALAPAILAT